MGFNSVYQNLLELFPQSSLYRLYEMMIASTAIIVATFNNQAVDNRLLKAVAIEHATDPDRAVESILSEVLPFTSEKKSIVATLSATLSRSSLVLGSEARTDANDSHLLNDDQNVDSDSLASSFYDANDTDDVQNGITRVEELVSFRRCEEPIVDVNKAEKLVIPSGSLVVECRDDDCSTGNHEGESFVLSRDDEDKRTGMHAEYREADASVCYHGNVTQVCLNDAPSLDYAEEQQSFDCNLFGSRISAGQASVSVSATELDAESGIFFADYDKRYAEINNVVNVDFETDNRVTDAGISMGKPALDAVVTRSGQICRISVVEDIIEDAKNHKDALLSATETVLKLIEDVEHMEKEAEQAKVAAARGGLDILEKVEEIKKMLKHAKEANEMHAGEVYGEKSILATEVKELQTRLLGLADEKDKSLAMLDEMRKTLEARLAASEEEKIAAEKEMLEKREIARGALVEQELIMDKVVQESKLLQQEAEDNAKLRDFLMEKGHVDELQGEITVICHDVKSLKEKFDNRVSLSKSLSTEHTSFRKASSSSSSVKSHSSVMSGSSEPATGDLELSETLKILSQAPSSIDFRTLRSDVGEEIVVSGATPLKELLDDDWELFDF